MKPNTFTKLYAHCIFTPKGRESMLKDPVREEVQKYIYGVIKSNKCYPVAINGMQDHMHLLVGFNPLIAISDLIRDIKRASSLFINDKKLISYRFSWQEGYGAFTVGYRELDKIYHYIINQQIHHSKNTFRDEYTGILNEEGFKHFDDYMFEFYDPQY